MAINPTQDQLFNSKTNTGYVKQSDGSYKYFGGFANPAPDNSITPVDRSNINYNSGKTVDSNEMVGSMPKFQTVSSTSPYPYTAKAQSIIDSINNDSFYSGVQDQSNTIKQDISTRQSALDKITSLITGKSQDYKNQMESSGANKALDNINSLKLEITNLNNSMQNELNSVYKNDNQRMSIGALRGTDSAIQKEYSTQIAAKASIMSALQGNYDSATKNIKDYIDMKYGDLQNQYDNELKQIDLNYKSLSPLEQKIADQRKEVVQAQQMDLQQQAQDDAQKQTLLITALKNYPNLPASVRIQAEKAKNSNEALSILGQYLQDPLEAQNKRLDMAYKQSQIAKNYSDMANVGLSAGLNPAKFNATDKKNFQDIYNVISSATDWANTINTNKGKSSGTGVGGLIPGVVASQSAQDSRTKLNALNLKVQQWASGASLTKQQTDQVNSFMPGRFDSDSQIRNKLNSLVGFMNGQVNTIAMSNNQNAGLPTNVDLFNYNKSQTNQSSDPMGIR